jgi:hypothetical protein
MNRDLQMLLLVSFCAFFMAGDGVFFWKVHSQAETLAGLRREMADSFRLRSEYERLVGLRPDPAEMASLRRQNSDLLKLRNEVSLLRQDMEAQQLQEPEIVRQLQVENEELKQRQKDLRELPNRADCIKNLFIIDQAKRQWATEKDLLKGETVTMDALASYFTNGLPSCPEGGHYSVNRIGAPPGCSLPGHSIP